VISRFVSTVVAIWVVVAVFVVSAITVGLAFELLGMTR
jgi:hypothetical protein